MHFAEKVTTRRNALTMKRIIRNLFFEHNLGDYSGRPSLSFRGRDWHLFTPSYVDWLRNCCRSSVPHSWYLVQETFSLLNGSISNITGWKAADPTSGEIPRLFWFRKNRKPGSYKYLFSLEKKPASQNRDSEGIAQVFALRTKIQSISKSIQTYLKLSKSSQIHPNPNLFFPKIQHVRVVE